MSIIKAFCIAFSTYSKIPMPQFEWKEEDMRYHFIFFPWVGAVIGGVLYGWGALCRYLNIPPYVFALIGAAIPLIITGGFHVDGFMDTMDAWRSYKSKEDKLEIMKDPHIGAFSVLMLAVCGLIYVAAVSLLDADSIGVFCLSFVLARCLSGITVLTFSQAKQAGMVHTMAEHIGNKKGVVLIVLFAETILCALGMIRLNVILGAASILIGGLFVLYYYVRTKREIGGITGDTAGYFVTTLETIIAVTAAIYAVICNLC